jgi:predicted enzyme related to lactoylglutathione lyase
VNLKVGNAGRVELRWQRGRRSEKAAAAARIRAQASQSAGMGLAARPIQEVMIMLGSRNAVANVAVKNLATAKKFYEGTLGLKPVDEVSDEIIVFKSGDSVLNVYRSDYAGTNKATAVTWSVDDLEGEIRNLKEKGVTFEHYDIPNMKLEGDIHVCGDMRVAWFKDPDGNILNLVKH